MRKFIFSILVVLVLIFILDFAIGRTLRYFYFRENQGFEYSTTYAMDSTKADVLVFGASRAKYHYVPKVFDDSLKMSFYNTGNDGEAIFFQLAVLRAALKRHTPKIIILDYNSGLAKGEDGYNEISFLLPYYKTHEEIRRIVELKSPYERVKLVSEIYPFNSKIITIILNNLSRNNKKDIGDRGFLPRFGEWQYKIDTIRNTIPYIVDTNKLNALHEFLNIAKESGAKLFVVYSPIYERYEREPDEISICKGICSSENIPFWDLSQDTLFQNNVHLFFDTHHLNMGGASLFSKIVANEIKEYMDKDENALADITNTHLK